MCTKALPRGEERGLKEGDEDEDEDDGRVGHRPRGG